MNSVKLHRKSKNKKMPSDDRRPRSSSSSYDRNRNQQHGRDSSYNKRGRDRYNDDDYNDRNRKRTRYDREDDYERKNYDRKNDGRTFIPVVDRSRKSYGKDVEEAPVREQKKKEQEKDSKSSSAPIIEEKLKQQSNKDTNKKDDGKQKKDEEEQELTPEQIMMQKMGLPVSFNSSKGKPAPPDSKLSGAKINVQRKFKQHMNKKAPKNDGM
jgi:U4/U6.U5 tri-snRNP-associated protein 3